MNDAIELSLYLRDQGCNPEQVQDFYPTPGTASTVMYYTGINPLDMKHVYAPDDYREKLMQRALLQYRRPENRNLVREALIKAGREDLIGFDNRCLVKPDMRVGSEYMNTKSESKKMSKNSKPTVKNGAKADKKSKNETKKGGKPLAPSKQRLAKSNTSPVKNQKRGKSPKK